MSDTIKLSIVTPTGEIYCDDVKSVVLPGKDGEFGVMPAHSSLVSSLTVGVIEITKSDASVEVIAILGMDELSEADKMVVERSRKVEKFLSQPFFVAEVFTGSPGKYVELADTIAGFKGILEGTYDHMPENAFYMVGSMEEAIAKAESMKS